MIDGGMLHDARKYCLLCIAEAWKLTTSTTIKNCFALCGFPVDHIYSNDNNAMKLNADKENDWHSLDTHQVQVADHMTNDNALRVCGVHCQVLDHQLSRPKEESEMERKRMKREERWKEEGGGRG